MVHDTFPKTFMILRLQIQYSDKLLADENLFPGKTLRIQYIQALDLISIGS